MRARARGRRRRVRMAERRKEEEVAEGSVRRVKMVGEETKEAKEGG
jgi:hypothetical protein